MSIPRDNWKERLHLAAALLDVPRFELEPEASEGDDFIEIAAAIVSPEDREYPRKVELRRDDPVQMSTINLLHGHFSEEHSVWDFISEVE